MRELFLGICVCHALLYVGNSYCVADGEVPTIDAFLDKWEEASQNIQTLDAKLTVLQYDSIFGGDQPDISEGRFYFEATGVGYYENSTSDEVVVWNGDEILILSISNSKCSRWSRENLQATRESNWSLGRAIAYSIPMRPQEHLPLVVDIDAAAIAERFALTLTETDAGLLLTASPKLDEDKARYDKIEVIVNAETYLTSAIQIHAPKSKGRIKTTYILNESKLNSIPSDRAQLIEPDLEHFRVLGE